MRALLFSVLLLCSMAANAACTLVWDYPGNSDWLEGGGFFKEAYR